MLGLEPSSNSNFNAQNEKPTNIGSTPAKVPRMSITLRPDEVQRALRFQQPLRHHTVRKLCTFNPLVFELSSRDSFH